MTSVFEIIGPVMVGPSSSHTAGMARIGTAANKLFGKIHEKISLTFSPGMKNTYKGHKSDAAVIGGILGFGEASPQLKNAIEEARNLNIEIKIDFFDDSCPPNTVLIELESQNEFFSLEGVSVGGGSIVINKINGDKSDYVPELFYGTTVCEKLNISRIDDVVDLCEKSKISLAEFAIQYEKSRSGFDEEKIRAIMQTQLEVMKKSVKTGIVGNNQMLYGLTGGKDAKKMLDIKDTICGGNIPKAVSYAIAVMEHNASMGCIVAAPTAGSAGIIPGCLLALQEKCSFSDAQLCDALFSAAIFGVVMAHRKVSFSGSVGGCQGEIGVSSAIAAVAITSLFTKNVKTAAHAMAMCMKNLLGLVCDQIAGPIEVPCIKRNAIGVANAFISAEMANAGVESYIPPDEVIDALIDVQNRMPKELKCTVCGGLACTDSAKALRAKLGQ